MSVLYVHIEPADDSADVLLRTSSNSNPDRKPPMRVARSELAGVLLMLLDAANGHQVREASNAS
ncbi:hypothetical protein LGN24_07330 [Burkholderia seminalis]|uniref:hypothetical protein n=1 Tax=Burkholderia seminalis TaxID=488731 RepID=UPI001CF28E20|nr:hypothetical protein [Burkholderia seminalis]MCA8301294.1 hypothetical protein [Burkholderia seminalis]